MPDEMGTFRVNMEIENPARSGERRVLKSVLVGTGSYCSDRAPWKDSTFGSSPSQNS